LQDKEECSNTLHDYIESKAAGLSFLPIHIKKSQNVKIQGNKVRCQRIFVFIIKRVQLKHKFSLHFLCHTFSHQSNFKIWEHHTTINFQWETTQQTGSADDLAHNNQLVGDVSVLFAFL
jgi:hypothetical protein